MKEITPPHLRCATITCVAVYSMDDGDLVVVGKKPAPEVAEQIQARVEEDEYAIVISPDYFRDLPTSSTAPA